MAVADHQMGAGALAGGDHAAAVVEAQRHRLFDQDMLAMGRRQRHMLGVQLVRRGHVHPLDLRVGA